MALPKESDTQSSQIKPASKDKQILRQEQVKKMQKENQANLEDTHLPQALPIDDKYIFGLAKPQQNDANQPPQTDKDAQADAEEDEEDEEDNLQSHVSRFSPHEYSEVWDKKEFLKTSSGGTFCCYSAGIEHNNLVFVCLHGCGHAALSYSMVAETLKEKYQVFAFDYRGHGETAFDGDTDSKSNDTDSSLGSMHMMLDKKKAIKALSEEYKMSKDNLVNDIVEIVKLKYGTEDPPPIVLVGHSLGGALAVHVANVKGANGIASLVGIVVIDLVEGTALNSLIHMRSIINARPKSFDSAESAVKWCVRSGMIRNYKSARMSVPPMFVKQDNGQFAWRTKVLLTEPFWRDWFVGLSDLFLKSPVSKMLMLADTDRLDKALTIGQMQGKYEMCIVGCGVGHTLHEDAPKKVADKLLHFAERNQFIKMWALNKKFRLKKK